MQQSKPITQKTIPNSTTLDIKKTPAPRISTKSDVSLYKSQITSIVAESAAAENPLFMRIRNNRKQQQNPPWKEESRVHTVQILKAINDSRFGMWETRAVGVRFHIQSIRDSWKLHIHNVSSWISIWHKSVFNHGRFGNIFFSFRSICCRCCIIHCVSCWGEGNKERYSM